MLRSMVRVADIERQMQDTWQVKDGGLREYH